MSGCSVVSCLPSTHSIGANIRFILELYLLLHFERTFSSSFSNLAGMLLLIGD